MDKILKDYNAILEPFVATFDNRRTESGYNQNLYPEQQAMNPITSGSSGRNEAPKDGNIPFMVFLKKNGSSYSVTVNRGFVCERALTIDPADESLILSEPSNRLDVDGEKEEFPITVGQAIYVVVKEDADGRVKTTAPDDVRLSVSNAGATQSSNFEPPSTGAIYYYKLAELIADGTSAKLDYYLAGSHIYHSTGLNADFRILDCGVSNSEGTGYLEPPEELHRMSFVGGKLVALDDFTRAIAENEISINLPGCSSSPASIP